MYGGSYYSFKKNPVAYLFSLIAYFGDKYSRNCTVVIKLEQEYYCPMELVSTVEKAVSHPREFGDFVVVYQNSVKSFKSLIKAFIFYYNLDTEASLWDITSGDELLEKKLFKSNGCS